MLIKNYNFLAYDHGIEHQWLLMVMGDFFE